MSQFDYGRLQEEDDPGRDIHHTHNGRAGCHDDTLASLTTDGEFRHHDAFTVAGSEGSYSHTRNNNLSTSQIDVKYTALRPTTVVEEECDEDVDRDDFGSLVQLTVLGARRRKLRRFHVLVLALLGTAFIIVLFCLLYVFVFFPSSHGQVVFPDGKVHKEDISKKLGKNVVATSCGLVRGVKEGKAHVFKGIPYALPPTGKKRWKPPEPRNYDSNSCWKGILNATEFGNKCVQPNFVDSSNVEGDEDCLFLNVWTPSLNPATNLPVMVWLHSGDLVHGSGHMPGMTPTSETATATKAVYVSLNYRLGVFGFLALDVLRERGEPERNSGNYGIMDQLLALKWVKENIRHFGGNQFDITIFGHGSGATSIQALLSSHWSHGLFHKAWMSSPVAILNKTLDDACKDNKRILEETKCSSASCLRSLNAKVITKASPWPLEPYWTLDQVFNTPVDSQIRNGLAIFDGHVVNWSSEREGPVGVDVSVVLGTTYFEISNLLSEKRVIQLTEDEFNDMIVHYTSSLGTDTVIQMKRLYSTLPYLHYSSPTHFPPRPSASLAHLIGDIKNVCPLKILANAMEFVYSSSVYMYTAEIYPSHNILLSSNETNSFVGWDLLAFFYGFDDLNFKAGQSDINFRNLMRQEIMSFVKTGKPISTRWKTVDHNTGIIEKAVTVRPSTSEYFDQCQFWDHHKFFQYSWRYQSEFEEQSTKGYEI